MLLSATFSTNVPAHRNRPPVDKKHLGRLLTKLARRHHVPAAQLAIHADGQTVSVTAGGPDAQAKFPVGSITKAFTATLAMQLIADGDLDLDDRVGEYLGDLGLRVGQLTVRQMLSHTSGLPSSLGTASDEAGSPRRYQRDCRDVDYVQPPGRGFSYSNVGYVLIGHVIEEITGMDWWDAVEALLLAPLGIAPTFIVELAGRQPKSLFLPGHAVNAATGRARAVEQTLRTAQAPAGALALSARDLVAFGRMHLSDTGLLAPEQLRQMRKPLPDSEPFGLADGWGLGLALFEDADTDWVGHDGTADGTSCHLRIDPVHGRVIALTTNAGTGSALWVELVDELRAMGVPVGDYELSDGLEPWIKTSIDLSGSYTNGDMEYVVNTRENGKTELSVDGENYPELAVHGGGAFSVREPASGRRIVGGRFLKDPSTGRVSGIQAGGRVASRGQPVSRLRSVLTLPLAGSRAKSTGSTSTPGTTPNHEGTTL